MQSRSPDLANIVISKRPYRTPHWMPLKCLSSNAVTPLDSSLPKILCLLRWTPGGRVAMFAPVMLEQCFSSWWRWRGQQSKTFLQQLFYNCIVLSHGDFSVKGSSGYFPQGKPAVTELCYPTCGARWVFKGFHNPLNSDMGCRIFSAHTDFSACDCPQGCTDTIGECVPKLDSGRKIPNHMGKLNMSQRHAGRMLHQLSYIGIKSWKRRCRLLCPL